MIEPSRVPRQLGETQQEAQSRWVQEATTGGFGRFMIRIIGALGKLLSRLGQILFLLFGALQIGEGNSVFGAVLILVAVILRQTWHQRRDAAITRLTIIEHSIRELDPEAQFDHVIPRKDL